MDIKASLDKIMFKNGYEHIGFLVFSFNEQSLVNTGLIQYSETLFVLHLFEPFIAEPKEAKLTFKWSKPFNFSKDNSDHSFRVARALDLLEQVEPPGKVMLRGLVDKFNSMSYLRNWVT